MAVFLFGVLIGWVLTFICWTVWSFGILSGFLVGSSAGVATIFLFFAARSLISIMFGVSDCRDASKNNHTHCLLKKVI